MLVLHRVAQLLLVALVGGACSASPPVAPSPSPATADPSPSTSSPSPVPSPSPSASVDPSSVTVAYQQVAEVFEAPVLALPRPGSSTLWIVEQPGRVQSLSDDGERHVVADLTDLVAFSGERGLLGLAFAPDHADSGLFYLHYSADDAGGSTRIERWSIGEDGPAVRGSLVLELEQPARNHNGGMLLFGPDAMLYVGLGDGGGANDTYGNGQRPDTLLGTILRLDVTVEPYAIPDDNPFVGGTTADGAPAAEEVWAFGLRNPWRMWFDEGLLYVADVGQDRYEELDVLGPEDGGANLGWPIREGSHCLGASECRSEGLLAPILEYGRGDGCSVIGGVVNRGPAVRDLQGHWFYSDFCSGFLRSVRVGEDGTLLGSHDWTDQVGVPGQVLSFGTDHEGNVLVLTADGRVLRVVAS